MLRSLFTSASGLAAQQFNLDVISNNLANVSTTGFKKSRANFEDLIYQTQRDPGTQTGANSTLPTGSQVGLGVSAGTTSTMHTQGTMISTGNSPTWRFRATASSRSSCPTEHSPTRAPATSRSTRPASS